MITGIEVPLELAALVCAVSIGAGIWAGQVRANRRLDPRRSPDPDPLATLIRSGTLTMHAVDLATQRNARRAGSQAVLHGGIDQFSSLAEVWNRETRSEVREHVAAVMRAGLRRDDRIVIEGNDRFTIHVAGADERAALRIADRLRGKLARLRLPQLGSEGRLTMSFGVAADRFGDTEQGLDHRARHAFQAAVSRGDDHVVPASEIEEILLLPAPAPSALSAQVSAA